MKIVDSVIGFNELDLFDIRYNELKNVVDKFVILEATHTHSGKPKPLYFGDADLPDNVKVYQWDNGETFAPLLPEYAWHREHTMREVLRHILLENYSGNDVVLVSDMDEIPRSTEVSWFCMVGSSGIWRFDQVLSYLYLNTTAGNWHGTRIFHMRDMPQTMKEVRYDNTPDNVIVNGGWHFSSIGNTERINLKLRSYAHAPELDHIDRASIQDSIDNLTDPFNKQALTLVDCNFLPKYVLENIDYYKSAGYIK